MNQRSTDRTRHPVKKTVVSGSTLGVREHVVSDVELFRFFFVPRVDVRVRLADEPNIGKSNFWLAGGSFDPEGLVVRLRSLRCGCHIQLEA
jgi:hypothetical protein